VRLRHHIPAGAGVPPADGKPVGRESEAHPAISIIPSLDFERYHPPPIEWRARRPPHRLNHQVPLPTLTMP
jgi:hypothetical protein